MSTHMSNNRLYSWLWAVFMAEDCCRGVSYFYYPLQCVKECIKECIKQQIKASNPTLLLQLIRQPKPERSRSPSSFAYFRWYPTTLTVFVLENVARQKPAMFFSVSLVPGEKGLFFYTDRSSTSEKTTLNFADNKEVFQSEYSQHAILRSAHFRRVVKL